MISCQQAGSGHSAQWFGKSLPVLSLHQYHDSFFVHYYRKSSASFFHEENYKQVLSKCISVVVFSKSLHSPQKNKSHSISVCDILWKKLWGSSLMTCTHTGFHPKIGHADELLIKMNIHPYFSTSSRHNCHLCVIKFKLTQTVTVLYWWTIQH